MRTAIVNLETMIVESIYDGAPTQETYSGPWKRPESFSHIQIPENVTSNFLVATQDGDDIVISENQQPTRDFKLARLRDMRNEKMRECDTMLNDLVVGIRTDSNAIRDYRESLKDLTDDYKYSNDPEKGKAALDVFESDLSDFTFPTKPE